jgi:hypothetical protein
MKQLHWLMTLSLKSRSRSGEAIFDAFYESTTSIPDDFTAPVLTSLPRPPRRRAGSGLGQLATL